MPTYRILEQRFPRTDPKTGEYVANLRETGWAYEAPDGITALRRYRAARSVCRYPLVAERIVVPAPAVLKGAE